MTTISSVSDKWTNQQIKKKFRNRSCGSRAKRAASHDVKSVPQQMIRGWIRGKAARNGKLGKDWNRSHAALRELQFQSVRNYEYTVYGDGYDDYDEFWWSHVNDPWLKQQKALKKQKIQRKPIHPMPKTTTSVIAKSKPKNKPLAAFKPKPKAVIKPVSPPKPAVPKKTHFDDIVYKKSDHEEKEYAVLSDTYIQSMSDIEGYGIYSSIEGLADRSSFSSHKNDAADPKSDNFKKIMKEIRKQLPQNVCTAINGSMFIRFDENNPRFLQAVLTGLDDTPYENGMFLFDIYLNSNYPQSPLDIKHISKGATLCHANNGPGGFSPNLHQTSGKVCLSLLGTWSGPGWIPGESNTYQVLSTIMFMIFGADHPYYMEPSHGGWEGTVCGRTKHEKRVIEYDEEVMFHNVRYSMLETIRNPYVGFEDVIKMHFKLKRKWIIKRVEWWMKHENYSQGFKDKMKRILNELKEELMKL